VTNPAFKGTIPELDAIDMSTLRPGVGDSVGMTPRSSAEGYGGAESATVYGPDGQTLNVTRNDERFRWTPEQTGTHTIRLDLLEHYRRRVYRDGPRGRRGKPRVDAADSPRH